MITDYDEIPEITEMTTKLEDIGDTPIAVEIDALRCMPDSQNDWAYSTLFKRGALCGQAK